MWNELESYKNHFLQWQLPHLKAEPINKMMKKEFDRRQLMRNRKCFFPSEAKCKHSSYFFDRAQLAYGWFMLPKLMKELCSDSPIEKWRAINSLAEVLQNPMYAQRAIIHKGIIRKTQNIFFRIQHNFHTEYFQEGKRLLKIFHLLSFYINGARQIASRKILLNEFYRILKLKIRHQHTSTKILRNLSEKPEILMHLLETTDSFEQLTEIYMADRCQLRFSKALWTHLSHFLEVAPVKGIENGFFELLHERIRAKQENYERLDMKCFALLLRCEEGQKCYDRIDGVKMMYTILTVDELQTYEYAVMIFLHGLVSKHALWRSREFSDLPDILIKLAKETENARLQLYCIQALRMLGDMLCIKNYMRAGCLTELNSFDCLNELNECKRDELSEWLQKEIYDTSE